MAIEIKQELVDELTSQILTGNQAHIPEDAFTEALSSSDPFWVAVTGLIKAHYSQASAEDKQSALNRFFGYSNAIATTLALDSAPTIAQQLMDASHEEHAARRAEELL